MGIYNCASTLQESIESIIAQTYCDWELIMCDDGSTDKTYEIASEYCKSYKNIKLIKNATNKGLNYTLNRCLEVAQGEYIARMDGDDISSQFRLEKEVAFLDNNPNISIVSTAMEYFDESGTWGSSFLKESPEPRDFIKGTPFCHAPAMVRKIAYDDVGGYTVDTKLLRVEDYHLWFKMYIKGYKGINLSEKLYKMRDDRNAINRRKFKYRINEAYVKWLICKGFELSIYEYIYILKPLITGLIPKSIYRHFHKKKFNWK